MTACGSFKAFGALHGCGGAPRENDRFVTPRRGGRDEAWLLGGRGNAAIALRPSSLGLGEDAGVGVTCRSYLRDTDFRNNLLSLGSVLIHHPNTVNEEGCGGHFDQIVIRELVGEAIASPMDNPRCLSTVDPK